MKLIASLALIIAACASLASAQAPHIHGGEIPDWYDPACCNQRDCRPVDDSSIEFDTLNGAPVVRYKPTGDIFTRERWKTSQDERYHVCIWNGTPLCVYIRSGA